MVNFHLLPVLWIHSSWRSAVFALYW